MINLILTLLVGGLSIYLFLKWITKNHDVFEKQGLKNEKPFPLIGNSTWIFTLDGIERVDRPYKLFPNEKVVGLFEFSKPTYLLRTPEVIKQLTIKDFTYFQDHVPLSTIDNDDMFSNILFLMKGKKWRDMRSSLSPMFTGRKMRIMLELIRKCSQDMCEYLKEEYEKNGPTAYPMKKLFAKYANDVIATCAFGVEVNSFKNPNNEINDMCQKMLGRQNILQIVKFLILRILPRVAKFLRIKIVPNEVIDAFTKLITHTMEVRKKENIQRPDMLNLLMKLKEGQLHKENDMDEIDPENKMINGEIKGEWSDIELIAQCLIFFLAGFDTTSTALQFCSYELAANPDLQEKLIAEIDDAHESLDGAPLSYEILHKMKYLDMFICEVLRMWAPIVVSDRECTKTYTYEDEDGLKFTIEKGNMILVPIYSLHMDSKYFPNPKKFDPERFSDENRRNIDVNTYLPFGVGPRNCIGFRFALMEVKAIIFHLLLNFRIVACEETVIPIKVHRTIFGQIPKKPITLQFMPRKEKTLANGHI